MTRAPDWTSEEFETLVGNNHLASSRLAELLPRRSPDAVEVVRQGIHRFHVTGDGSMLADMMRRRLADKHRPVTCPVCKALVRL